MQTFEGLFLLVLAVAIARLVLGPIHPRFSYSTIGLVGLALTVAGMVVEGWRWQMIPAYAGFGLLILGSLKSSPTGIYWRAAGAIPLVLLLATSGFLTHQLPVLSLPAPTGPYSVGTFDYSITDTSRPERYAPERDRELYVEVWYPADKARLAGHRVRSLGEEIYGGDYDIRSFLTGYFRHIPTHSHVAAPVAAPEAGAFPVLLFSHGMMGFTAQNPLLMEHLASHGYVIFSIAHPYQSTKVILANAGTVTLAYDEPKDVEFRLDDMELGLMGRIIEAAETTAEVTEMRTVLYRLADDYSKAQTASAKAMVLEKAVTMPELQRYGSFVTTESLRDYLRYHNEYVSRAVQTWVEDTGFVATSVSDRQWPITGLSEAIDVSGFGVFGMSFGGAAAGEFCKLDSRCRAGANLDGTQLGYHWNKRPSAPFLMFYHEAHQGGNDFAYLPPTHDFWDYTVKGSMHFDFADAIYALPIIKTLGFGGAIDAGRMVEIVNRVQLDFFDHYLKGEPIPPDLHRDLVEVVVDRHIQ